MLGEAFPPSQRKPVNWIAEDLTTHNDFSLLAAIEGNSLKGCSATYFFKQFSFGLLDYIVVSPKCRGIGIGSQLFSLTLEHLHESIGPQADMFIEVDSEKNELPLHENAARKMRLKFYRKLGAKMITDRYLIPHFDGSEPEEMYLMIKPVSERHFFEREQLIEYVGAIHKRVYRYGTDLADKMTLALPKTIQLS